MARTVRARSRDGRRVRIGAPDGSVTAFSGTAALGLLVERLDGVGALDRQVGPLKQRRRGVGAGGLLVATAQAQLLDGESWSALDHQRDDPAWQRLSAFEAVPSTTAAGLARRFDADRLRGVEQGLADVLATAFELLPAQRRAALAGRAPTIDLDATDVEVYASKQGVAYNHTGQRVGRPHLAMRAEARGDAGRRPARRDRRRPFPRLRAAAAGGGRAARPGDRPAAAASRLRLLQRRAGPGRGRRRLRLRSRRHAQPGRLGGAALALLFHRDVILGGDTRW